MAWCHQATILLPEPTLTKFHEVIWSCQWAQGLFCVCTQSMSDSVTVQRHLSLPRRIHIMVSRANANTFPVDNDSFKTLIQLSLEAQHGVIKLRLILVLIINALLPQGAKSWSESVLVIDNEAFRSSAVRLGVKLLPVMIERHQWFNKLSIDVIWRYRSGSILAQIMACSLTAPSHYLNQCWLIINRALWHSPKTNFAESSKGIYS